MTASPQSLFSTQKSSQPHPQEGSLLLASLGFWASLDQAALNFVLLVYRQTPSWLHSFRRPFV